MKNLKSFKLLCLGLGLFFFSFAYAVECPIIGNSDTVLPQQGENLFYNYMRIYSYQYLGANLVRNENCKITGSYFRVWLPNANNVEVITSLDNFKENAHLMAVDPYTGIWGIFIPGIQPGMQYKYKILDSHGNVQYRNDPYARYVTKDNDTDRSTWNSVVIDPTAYKWSTPDMSSKLNKKKLRLYEVHPGTIIPGKKNATFKEIATYLIAIFKRASFNAVSFMPISQHNVYESWGYQPGPLFSTDYRHGTPDDFKAAVDLFHQQGISVIIDLVHSHASKDWDTGLGMMDGTQLYFHEGIMGEHPQWGTYLYNYGRIEVKDFLLSNALFWLDEYKIDGFRFDGVASMLYLDFGRQGGPWIPAADGSRNNYDAIDYIKAFNRETHRFNPNTITIAEESSGYQGVTNKDTGLAFDYEWRMGGMHHIREFLGQTPNSRNLFILRDPIFWGETYVNYTNSHDEVSQGKRYYIDMMGEYTYAEHLNIARNIEILNAIIYPGLPMDFMGDEFGNSGWWDERTSPHTEWVSPENDHFKFETFMKDLGAFYLGESSLENVQSWSANNSMVDNPGQVLVQTRKDATGEDQLIIVQNYNMNSFKEYDIPIPSLGPWNIVFNSDNIVYGGRGTQANILKTLNQGIFSSPYSLRIGNLPAQATIILKKNQHL